MFVQDPAGSGQESFWKTTNYFTESLRFPWRSFFFLCPVGVPVVGQQFLSRSEPVFKGNQAILVKVRTTEVDLMRTCRFAFLNEPPEQERHTAKIVESCVGASIFENEARAMSQCEYGRDRSATFPGQPDLNFVVHAFDQVSEPDSRLGEQMMTPPGHLEKPVEFLHKLLRAAGFVSKSFLFCPLDLALKGILVQSPKKLL